MSSEKNHYPIFLSPHLYWEINSQFAVNQGDTSLGYLYIKDVNTLFDPSKNHIFLPYIIAYLDIDFHINRWLVAFEIVYSDFIVARNRF